MKEFCARHGAHRRIQSSTMRSAPVYLGDREPPFVIKAMAFAAGKGVVIAETRREADAAIDEILFLRSSHRWSAVIVIEDSARRRSQLLLCDGETAVLLVAGARPQARARPRQGPEHRRHGASISPARADLHRTPCAPDPWSKSSR